jgi:hypothetical protein
MTTVLLIVLAVVLLAGIVVVSKEYKFFRQNLITCIENNWKQQINFRSFDDWLHKYRDLRTPKWALRLLVILDSKFDTKFETITLFKDQEKDLMIRLAP